MSPHPLKNWSAKVLSEWTRFKGVFSVDKLPKKIKVWGLCNKPW